MPTTYAELDKGYIRRGMEIISLKQDIEYLLKVLENLRTFKLPISLGLDPTMYATLSYEGDLEIAKRIEEIRGKIS